MIRESCYHKRSKSENNTEMCAFLTSKKEKKSVRNRQELSKVHGIEYRYCETSHSTSRFGTVQCIHFTSCQQVGIYQLDQVTCAPPNTLIMHCSNLRFKREKLITDIFRAIQDFNTGENRFFAKKNGRRQIKEGKMYEKHYCLEMTRRDEKRQPNLSSFMI